MPTWDNLLDGYSFLEGATAHGDTVVHDIFSSNILTTLYLQMVQDIHFVFEFLFGAFTSSALGYTAFFALLITIVYAFFHRLR